MILFGPSGNSDSFRERGYKSFQDVPRYVKEMGLDCYEYQCGRGVKISRESAQQLGELCRKAGVVLSLHAPYYISLSGLNEQTRLKSVDYILQSAAAASAMGAQRVVVHSGSCGKQSRQAALELAKDTLFRARKALVAEGYAHIRLCPETMGKINQLGTLTETLELCLVDDSFIPCVDFGHLNARTLGGFRLKADFINAFDEMERTLGRERMQSFHCHFSRIEYSAGGEKQHLIFADERFGPDYRPFLEAVAERGLTPQVQCESAGTQAEDARTMKIYYRSLIKEEREQ